MKHARALLSVLIGGMVGSVFAGLAPYVDSKTIKDRFKEVSVADMELLRGKKILFASRSFGLNMRKGLMFLARKDKKYEILGAYKRFDVFKAGGDLSAVPANAFDEATFVHVMATFWPPSKRIDEVAKLLSGPHKFGDKADVVMLYAHPGRKNSFDLYASKMDALQAKYPKIKFIYVTPGYMGPKKPKRNEMAFAFGEKVRERYQGKVLLYDLGKILSDDHRVGHQYCPEYSNDAAGVHPNLPAGEEMMAKGFLLILRDAFRYQGSAKLTRIDGGDQNVETLPASHPEARAVRAILDFNGLRKKKVNSVSVVKDGHIVELYLQEGGVHTLTEEIGRLKHLRLLHLYGDRKLEHRLLTKISPAIGRCRNLEELLLNDNELVKLPREITSLQKLKLLAVGDNKLRDQSPEVVRWLRKRDPKGLARQR